MSDKEGSSSTQGSGSYGKKYESLIPAKKKIVSTMVGKKVAGYVTSAINNKNNKVKPDENDNNNNE